MWYRLRRRRKKRSSVTKHYLEHKESARELVLARLVYFNQYYNFSWGRVAIRNQKSRWGSCSQKGNLNFNYRILFLPPALQDYIIVHELCHLKELHHRESFWKLVAEQVPDFAALKGELRQYEKGVLAKASVG